MEEKICVKRHISNSSLVVNDDTSTSKVNFRYIETNDSIQDADFIVPKSSVDEVKNRCANTLWLFHCKEGGVPRGTTFCSNHVD